MAKKSRVRASINIQRHPPQVRVPKTIRHALPKRRLATNLNLYQDNRTWHPERVFRPALSIIRHGAARIRPLRLAKPTKWQLPRLTEPLRFPNPRHVLICIRRKIRERIMHATGGAGRKVRKPKRNQWSDIKC